MKKFLIILLTTFLTFNAYGCDIKDLCLTYDETVQYDNFTIAINDSGKCCFVGCYTVEKYTENMEITIPDYYEDIPIERIGGYFGTGAPTPFCIDIPEYLNSPENSSYSGVFIGHPDTFNLDVKYTVVDLPFRLNIGKNINEISNVSMDSYFPYINDDGSITFYHPVVEISCSIDNEHFYSKDGKLYDRENDELITEFAYKYNE